MMRHCSCLLLLVLLSVCIPLPSAAAEGAAEYFPAEPDPLVGDYVGRWNEEEDVDPAVAAQVIALGRDRYRVRIVPKLDMRCPPHVDTEVEAVDGKLHIDEAGIEAAIADGKITGGRGRMKHFEMERVERLSPTLGKPAPEGAIVLFDGTNLNAWEGTEGWEITEDGVLMVTPDGDYLKTKEHYKDVELHLEFRTPFMPKARDQQRGNSGIFCQDEYEVQILDSYGLEGYYNECGALYKVAAPKVNACAPPLQWQTYDLKYTAPRYNEAGQLVANPRMTVVHNGVLIHNDQEMAWITGWKEKDRLKPHPKLPGPIKLQGHNNYVQYRNIWMVAGEK